MALTDIQVRTAKSREKPFKMADGGGLFLLINPNGSKLWRMKYRFEGKEKLLAFGAYPSVSLKKARKARDDAKEKLADQLDPSAEKKRDRLEKAAREEQTFAALAEQLLAKKKRDGKSANTINKNRWLIGKANAFFGDVPARSVSAPLILEALRKEEAMDNLENAKRLRMIVGEVLRFGIALGWLEADPTPGLRGAIATRRAKPHAAIVEPSLFGELLKAIENYEGQASTKIALKLMAHLAVRPGELRNAKWSEFDLVARVWEIPADRMKMRFPHTVPLSNAVVTLLDQLRLLNCISDFLFPALTSKVRPMSENTMNQALRRMGFSSEEHTSHGFRATFSTLANESGLWNPDAIERALAHADPNEIRKIYNRAKHWDERVRLADWWAERITHFMSNA